MRGTRFAAALGLLLVLVVGSPPTDAYAGHGPSRLSDRPSAPRDVRVVADPGYIRVLFRPPASNGGTPVASYRVYLMPSDVSRFCHSSDCALRTTGGETIRVDVVAVNLVGAGPPSPLSRWVATLPPMDSSPPPPIPGSPRPFLTSIWAGYAVTKGHFTAVSAQFVVPTVVCTDRTTEFAQWVGIDGFRGSTVEQDGIVVDCTDGSPTYYAFYEIFGDRELNEGGLLRLNETVVPGDLISASVSEARNEWSFRVNDLSRGWSSSNVVAMPSPAPAQSTAEVIVENPLFSCTEGFPCTGLTPPTFTTAAFSDVSITENHSAPSGIPSNPSTYALTMVSNMVTRAVPSPLSTGGTSFSVYPATALW